MPNIYIFERAKFSVLAQLILQLWHWKFYGALSRLASGPFILCAIYVNKSAIHSARYSNWTQLDDCAAASFGGAGGSLYTSDTGDNVAQLNLVRFSGRCILRPSNKHYARISNLQRCPKNLDKQRRLYLPLPLPSWWLWADCLSIASALWSLT